MHITQPVYTEKRWTVLIMQATHRDRILLYRCWFTEMKGIGPNNCWNDMSPLACSEPNEARPTARRLIVFLRRFFIARLMRLLSTDHNDIQQLFCICRAKDNEVAISVVGKIKSWFDLNHDFRHIVIRFRPKNIRFDRLRLDIWFDLLLLEIQLGPKWLLYELRGDLIDYIQ